MKEEYWTTKDGRTLAVGEMSESHVRNTLRMLIRKVNEHNESVCDNESRYYSNSNNGHWEDDFEASDFRMWGP